MLRSDVDWVDSARTALQLAEKHGDLIGVAAMYSSLAIAANCRGDLRGSAKDFRHALKLYEEIDDLNGQSQSLVGLGDAIHKTGSLPDAASLFQRSLKLHPEPIRYHVIPVLDLAAVHRDMGDLPTAHRFAATSVDLAHRFDVGARVSTALTTLGSIECLIGQCPEALAHHQTALEISRQLADIRGEIDAMCGLAVALSHLGQHQDATEEANRVWLKLQDGAPRGYEERALTSITEVLLSAGDIQGAARLATEAFDIHRSEGHLLAETRTLLLLGKAQLKNGDQAAAQAHFRRGLEIAQRIQAAETKELALLIADEQ
ncbi:tetratricopeptide repeat protein [Streptomyces sp. RB6PN25]|uniref:Tetratricopeptide repeat protein n=1 Tax=Streptomyces humicola TaxID=2953240 RepID=A0ABT1PXU2_9ACTN|nr:tetratricopeptide repeat protein [Streptomyces humicola]MCQ4082487.1 tetratricopeptide repeat protein [Streptomyces humicola]